MADEIVVQIEKRFAGGPRIRADFRLPLLRGSTAILFGPSGSGKTTVLRSVAGLEKPDSGIIQFGGELWFDSSRRTFTPPEKRNIGLLFQEYALFPHLTVRENIEYGLDHISRPERRRISDEMMRLFEITELADRLPRQISGGQMQRAALARAVAPQPRILLLDEPLAALDRPARGRLRTELRRLLERVQIPSLVVTHDRSEAISLGHQILVMAEGEVQQIGLVDEVFRRPANAAVAGIVGVETIFRGTIGTAGEGVARVQVNRCHISAVLREEFREREQVLVCIRAEDVTLQRETNAAESARNHFAGRVESIESDGAVERITIDCGFLLVAIITRNAREEMELRVGSPVTAAVKATAVHVVRL